MLQPVSETFMQEGDWVVLNKDVDKMYDYLKTNRNKPMYESGPFFYFDYLEIFPNSSYDICVLFEQKHMSILKNKKKISFEIMYMRNKKIVYQKYINIKIQKNK
jgi:hypothetical protein